MLKHSYITLFYYFLAEAIIAFIVILPITFEYFQSSHYWGFIFIIFLLGFCFFLVEVFRLRKGYFLGVGLIGMMLFYLFQFPVGLIIIFPLIFIWRYTKLRSYYATDKENEIYLHIVYNRYEKQREKVYLHIAMITSFVVVVYSKEVYVVVFTLILLLILLAGNMISRIAIVEKEEREHLHVNVMLIYPVIMLTGSTIIFYLFPPFRQVVTTVWAVFTSSVGYVLSFIFNIIETFIPDARPLELVEEHDIEGMQEEVDPPSLLATEYQQGIDLEVIVYVTIGVIILIIVYLILKAIKGERDQINTNLTQTATHYSLGNRERDKKGFFSKVLTRFFRRPSDPVRDLVYEFERKASKNDYGRLSYESVEDWFKRLKVDVNMSTYQKVRYGDIDVSDVEVKQLKKQLEEIEETLH